MPEQLDGIRGECAVELSAVHYSTGTAADGFSLNIASLVVRRGERIACVGPSGCGKTTLLRLISGERVPSRGEVKLFDTDLSRLDSGNIRRLRLDRVGIIFQSLALVDYLTAAQNIALPVRLSGQPLDRKRLGDLADRVGISGLLKRLPEKLSQGERQRVAICRALIASPELLLCDEPTGNLDPSRSVAITELILSEAERIGAAVIFVTHDHSLLDRFDRVLDMASMFEPEAAS